MNTTEPMTSTDPNTTAALSPDDPRWAFAGAVRAARAVMASITPEQWELPTPCEDMSVRQLLEHLVMVNRRVALAGRGVAPAQWPTDAADVADGDWLAAFTAAAHDIQDAWTDEALTDPRQLPWGTFPGNEVLDVYTNELTVHTWDLAQATGQHPDWDARVLEVAWDGIQRQLPTADRQPMWEQAKQFVPADQPWTDPFANAVEVPADAPLVDRLVAWNGRRP
jgi:uncharacterized protein (TIGR03086 family)